MPRKAKKKEVSKYLVTLNTTVFGPTGEQHWVLWGPVKNTGGMLRVGFDNDHIDVHKEDVRSKALMNVPPIKDTYMYRRFTEGKWKEDEIPFVPYICTDKKNKKYKIANELNQRLKK